MSQLSHDEASRSVNEGAGHDIGEIEIIYAVGGKGGGGATESQPARI